MMMKFYGRAEETAQRIIECFERGEVAEPLARVFISKGNLPMDGWSFLNRFVCLMSGCTDARGFKQWREAGRNVKRGETALANILVPLIGTREDEDGETARALYGFKSAAVFDITQTEGEPLPEEEWEQEFVNGLPLLEVAVAFGLNVTTYSGKGSGALGVFSSSRQLIGLGVEDVDVWLHELVHAADKRAGNLVEKGQHWRSETVAELGSTVLAIMLGMEVEADTGGAWRYIQHYAKKAGIEPVTACVRVIERTCQAINLILETGATCGTAEAVTV
jgi:hypothetical protein